MDRKSVVNFAGVGRGVGEAPERGNFAGIIRTWSNNHHQSTGLPGWIFESFLCSHHRKDPLKMAKVRLIKIGSANGK